MHNWSLLLVALLAVLNPITSFTDQSFVDGRERCTDRRLSQDQKSRGPLYGNSKPNYVDRRLNHKESSKERRENQEYETTDGKFIYNKPERNSVNRERNIIRSIPLKLVRASRPQLERISQNQNHRQSSLNIENRRNIHVRLNERQPLSRYLERQEHRDKTSNFISQNVRDTNRETRHSPLDEHEQVRGKLFSFPIDSRTNQQDRTKHQLVPENKNMRQFFSRQRREVVREEEFRKNLEESEIAPRRVKLGNRIIHNRGNERLTDRPLMERFIRQAVSFTRVSTLNLNRINIKENVIRNVDKHTALVERGLGQRARYNSKSMKTRENLIRDRVTRSSRLENRVSQNRQMGSEMKDRQTNKPENRATMPQFSRGTETNSRTRTSDKERKMEYSRNDRSSFINSRIDTSDINKEEYIDEGHADRLAIEKARFRSIRNILHIGYKMSQSAGTRRSHRVNDPETGIHNQRDSRQETSNRDLTRKVRSYPTDLRETRLNSRGAKTFAQEPLGQRLSERHVPSFNQNEQTFRSMRIIRDLRSKDVEFRYDTKDIQRQRFERSATLRVDNSRRNEQNRVRLNNNDGIGQERRSNKGTGSFLFSGSQTREIQLHDRLTRTVSLRSWNRKLLTLERDNVHREMRSNVDITRGNTMYEKSEVQGFSFDWQLLIYALQGIYISSIILQLSRGYGINKKQHWSQGLWPTHKLLKVD